LAREATAQKLLVGFPRIASTIEESVETDVPVDKLPDLLKLTRVVKTDEIISLGLNPPDSIKGWTAEGYPVPDPDLIQAAVRAVFEQAPESLKDTLGLAPAPQSCGWLDESVK
jgi:hypothetical protein